MSWLDNDSEAPLSQRGGSHQFDWISIAFVRLDKFS